MTIPKWTTQKKKIKDLLPYERNPRKATEKQWKDLGRSLNKFNLADPLIINRDGTIIGGHFRYRVLKEKGIDEVDVRVPDRQLTDKEVEELNIRLNKNLGEWDWDLLANFDEGLLKDIGFENEELDGIFGLEMADEFNEQKEFEKAVKNPRGVKPGDIWQLGEHKLIIGDCTKRENWERLLGEERFDLMETDPPYKSNYLKRVELFKKEKGFGYKANKRYEGLEERGLPEYDEWLSIANEFQNPKGANVMVFENWKNVRELWNAIEKYWKIQNMIIWWLPNRHFGWGRPYNFFGKYDIAPLAGEGVLNEEYEKELEDYLQEKGQKLLDTYEVILYGQKGKSEWSRKKGSKWAKITDHITWTASTEKSEEQSVIFGAKPIQILVPYIKVLSPREGIVMEPFGGSGSTIIACEIMRRRCRAIEIVPLYGEVILARWEKFTGQKARKI